MANALMIPNKNIASGFAFETGKSVIGVTTEAHVPPGYEDGPVEIQPSYEERYVNISCTMMNSTIPGPAIIPSHTVGNILACVA
jgi:hypothetical protein